jgi:hypothetical protein
MAIESIPSGSPIRATNDEGQDPRPRNQRTMNDIKIKIKLEFSISESDLEDGLAEYDELSVDSLISQILDKSIAVDEIDCKIVEGPNNLEEVDELRAASNAG